MIRLEHVTKIYNREHANAFKALDDVSLTIDDGEMAAVVGKSGAGKSTLLHILSCIDGYEEGEYYLDGQLIRAMAGYKMAGIRNEKIGLVMQDYALVEDYTALDNVMLPLDFARPKKKFRKTLALEALASVDMEEFAEKRVSRLSGGQKQRVAIARAVVNEPKLILADEPTGALDSGTAEEIMKLFHKLHEKGQTVVIVTHDIDVARQCDRVVELADGCIRTDSLEESRKLF